MPSAEIIAIGTELLLGEISDTNTRFIARALRSLGLDLFRVTTVGDNTARITEAIQSAMQRADVVLTTGGLGPTVDDPTRQAAAAALGVELEFQEDLWRQVVATVARYGRQAGENQKRQAFIPHGARAIPNPVGTAPAFLAESGSSVLVCLPGVPREMETLLEGAVVPYLRQRFSVPAVIEVRNLHLSGVSEAWVDERVGEYETQANPTVGLAAHNGIIDIRICAKAADVREAGRMIEQVEKEIRLAVGPALFGVDDDRLEAVVVDLVAGRGWKIAFLECGMDGELTRRISQLASPAVGGVRSAKEDCETFAGQVEALLASQRVDLALGVRNRAAGNRQEITVILAGATGPRQRDLTYGGHPANAPRWAANLALDFLRREIGDH